jgi:hypothetical protein
MEVIDYPLFEPPEDLVARGIQNWSPKEADRYRAWLLSVMPDRIRTVRRFLEIPDEAMPEAQLEAAGAALVDHLKRPEFSRQSGPETSNLRGKTIVNPPAQLLTPIGYAVAADVGLVFAELLLRGHALHWETVRKPKSDISYNLPVLAGFDGGMSVDPVALSAVVATGVLNGLKGPRNWAEGYRWWASKAPERV